MKKLLLIALFSAFCQSAFADPTGASLVLVANQTTNTTSIPVSVKHISDKQTIVCSMTGSNAPTATIVIWGSIDSTTFVRLDLITLPNASGDYVDGATNVDLAVTYEVQTTLTGTATSVTCTLVY